MISSSLALFLLTWNIETLGAQLRREEQTLQSQATQDLSPPCRRARALATGRA